jgi:hypothetical protein
MGVLNDLRGRGAEDILIACMDGWADRISRSGPGGIPGHPRSVVHCAHGTQFDKIGLIQRPEKSLRRFKGRVCGCR